MKPLLASILALLIFVFGPALADTSNQSPKLPRDLAKAAAAYGQAQIHNDRKALDRLLAADYMLVSGAAQVETKAQFIGDSTAVGFILEPYTIEQPIAKLWETGAVLAGAVTREGTTHGGSFKTHMRFADIWRKSAGKWQVVFTQLTLIPG